MSALTLYTAMTGLQAASYRQALQSNNLANVDTTGFRAQIGLLNSTPFVGSSADRGQADVVTEDAGASTRGGPIKSTGNPWDVALNGPGFVTVRRSNGQLALTRDGRLHQDHNGTLRDSHGDAVLGASLNPINLPQLSKIEIGADGTISGVPARQGTQQAQQFNRLFLAQMPKGKVVRIGDSRFAVPAGAKLQASPTTRVQQGDLEGSNVNAVKAMTQLITDTRTFQIQTRLVNGTQSAAQGLDALISQG